MKQTTESKPTRLSEVITARMEEREVTVKDLSKAIDIVYEHTRRIVRGQSPPSKFTLKAIAEFLKLNYKELLDLAKADKMESKFGDLPLSLAGKKPSLEPLDRVWDVLTESQQQDIISMAQGWAKRAKAAKS